MGGVDRWFLATNPAALAKLEEELNASGLLKTAQHPSPRPFMHADISKLHWLDCCIKVKQHAEHILSLWGQQQCMPLNEHRELACTTLTKDCVVSLTDVRHRIAEGGHHPCVSCSDMLTIMATVRVSEGERGIPSWSR